MSKKHVNVTESRKEKINEAKEPVVEIEEVVEPVVEIEEVVEHVVEIEEPITAKKIKMGKVDGCTKLNVRKKPTSTAEIVCVINRGTEVEIDEEKSTKEFYMVCTASGAEGFCVKDFIKIES